MEGRLDDEELVELAKRGDADAYGTLVKRYQELAFRIAYLVAGSAGEAEDATQEGFVKGFYALDRFRSGAAFKPWILSIVANQARDRARASARRGALDLRLREGGGADFAPDPEASALRSGDREALLEALRTLDEKDRLVIAYRYLLGLSEAEAAEVLGIRRGTVKSRLSRALRRLKAQLETEGVTA